MAIVDEEERVVYRLCHRMSTRPMQLTPKGTVLYWDGRLKERLPRRGGRLPVQRSGRYERCNRNHAFIHIHHRLKEDIACLEN